MATARCIQVCGRGEDQSQCEHLNGQEGGGLGDCERGLVVVASRAGPSVSQSADLYWDFLS